MTKSIRRGYIDVDGTIIPAIIHREMRRNITASFTRKNAILRIPVYETQEDKHIQWFKNWVHEQLRLHPELAQRYKNHQIKHGSVLEVNEKKYAIDIEETSDEKHVVRLKDGVIYCRVSQKDSMYYRQLRLRECVAHVVAEDHKPAIIQRVHQLNTEFFKQNIRQVKMSYTQTQWGSCSTNGVIQLSTRLLFTPPVVQDYVIVHELAHLLEHNHGKRFWTLVEKVMPDYRKHEKWLDENGDQCDF